MDAANRIFEYLKKKDLTDFVVESAHTETDQVRFSQDSRDLTNHWLEDSASIFISRNGRIYSCDISNILNPEEELDRAVSLLNVLPVNENFYGINDESHDHSGIRRFRKIDADIGDMAGRMQSSAISQGADRASGLIYNEFSTVAIRTQTNEAEYDVGGLHFLIRAFSGDFTGQEATHTGFGDQEVKDLPEKLGKRAAVTANECTKLLDPVSGKLDVLMGPHVMGNILSYGTHLFSAYSVDAGISCFEGETGEMVASENFTLSDDPLNFNGMGAIQIDDEGTPTKRMDIVKSGELKTYLHSFSTAKKFGVSTTGHAGIISPHPWQLNLQPGSRSYEKILSEMDNGLFIKNAWYTRFQDERNGVFSTVPRDGIFMVKNGEITGSIRGIRISDSVPNILKNTAEISSEQENVKWWEEIPPSFMPFVLVRDINISRSF